MTKDNNHEDRDPMDDPYYNFKGMIIYLVYAFVLLAIILIAKQF